MKELILSTMGSSISSVTVSSPIPKLKKLKIMLLAHAIKYHEARDWIRLQNQSNLTYQSLLAHCKLLEQRCEQYQKAQLRGRAELTTITAAASVTSPVHQDTVTTHRKSNCTRCGYSHPKGSCFVLNASGVLWWLLVLWRLLSNGIWCMVPKRLIFYGWF